MELKDPVIVEVNECIVCLPQIVMFAFFSLMLFWYD